MRIIFYFVSANVLVLAISFLVLYSQSSRTLVEEIGEHSESLLVNGARNTARLMEWSLDFAFSSSNDSELTVYALSDHYSDYETYEVWSRLMGIKMSNPSIDSVYLINDYTNTVIDSKLGLTAAADFYDQDILNRLRDPEKSDQTVLIPRKLPEPLSEGTFKDVITIVRLYEKGSSISAFVLNVDTRELMTLLQNNSQYRDRIIMVLNDHNEQVFSSIPLDSEQIQEYRDRADGLSGWEMYKPSNQEKQLIVYSNASIKGIQNWSFIEGIPRDVILKKIDVLRNLSILLFAGLFLASLAVTIWISKRVYSPIQDLVSNVMKQQQAEETSNQSHSSDELDYLSSVFTAQQEQIIELTDHWRHSKILGRERFLRELLGRGSLERAEIKSQFEEWDIELPEENISVVIFRIDHFPQFMDTYSEKDRRLLRFAMSNIVHESLKMAEQQLQTVDMGHDHVAVILAMSSPAEEFIANVKITQQLVQQYLSIGTTAAWGEALPHLHDLHEGYLETYELTQERFRFGHGAVIARSLLAGNAGDVYHLPIDKERQLAQAIHKTDTEAALEIMHQAVEELRILPYFECKMSLITLFMDMRRLIQDQTIKPLPSSFGLTSVENQIIQLETLDNLVPWIDYMLTKALDDLIAARSQSKNAGFVEEVDRIIAEQLSNHNLSSKMLADELGLSVNYLRSLYKAETNQSIPDTISQKRLECICRELLASDSPIEPIISAYGFSSLNTFYTVFKKVYGVTPAQYRKRHKLH